MAKTKINSPCIYFNLRKAARLTGQIYDGFFRKIGLRGTQYSLMMVISRMDGPSIGDLSNALGLEQSTVTRNIDLLVRKAYVQADSAPDDTRRKVLSVTQAGRKKLAEADSVWREAQDSIIERLGENDADQLLGILEHIIGKLE